MAQAHTWKFFRAGGLDQVRLESGSDLMHLDQLDPKLWVALSCPVKGLEFDERTLQLIDGDGDGRIRVPEIIAALKWAGARLKDPDDLPKGSGSLALAQINEATAEGRAVLASARQILRNLGKAEATSLSVDEAADTVKIFSDTAFNGDGIVPAATAKDPALAALIEEIGKRFGTAPDRSGKAGITQQHIDAAFAELRAFADWWKAGEASGALAVTTETAAAYGAYAAVKGKIDDYFVRCGLAAFDPKAAPLLTRTDGEYAVLAAGNLAGSLAVAALPLSRPEPKRPLDLVEGLNPAWAEAMAAFRSQVVDPMLGAGRTALGEADWRAIAGRFVIYESWAAARKGAAVEDLGIARVRELLASDAKARLDALVADDLAVKGEVSAVEDVERLLRYVRDLHKLTLNFVNFAHFYGRKQPAIFLVGTLFLDQRSCELCIRVEDPGAHVALATMSKIYIAYCVCTRPTGERMHIAAAFSQGDSDYLMVGRNGIFYDRKGRDWDATITKVIDNPISIRQAFWAPYKKALRFIEEQVAKRAAAADDASSNRLQSAANTTVATAESGKAPAEKPKFEVGTIAALGVALGAIGALLGGFVSGFLGLGMWMPLGIIGLVLAISTPSMLIAWLKLRQRTLGPVLEGNGWAINGRVKINIPLGTAFTAAKRLPPGSVRSLEDPFEDKEAKARLRWFITMCVLVALLAIGGWVAWRFWIAPRWFPATKVDSTTEIRKDGDSTKVSTETTVTPPPAAPAKPPEPAKP
jgi:hypothetical protein